MCIAPCACNPGSVLAGQEDKEWPAAGEGVGQEKPQVSSGGRRAARMACPPELGLRAPRDPAGRVPAAAAWSLCREPERQNRPGFKRDTKWSLQKALQQFGPRQTDDLTQGRGLEKHNVQRPLHARMLGLDRIINNATLIQQQPPPPYLSGTVLNDMHKKTTKAPLVSTLEIRNQGSHI